MYLDISFKKMGFITIVALLLVICVYSTNTLKMHYFGSTPFFYTITTAAKYAANSAFASIQRSSLFATSFFSRGDTEANAKGIPVLTYHRIVQNPNDTSNVSITTFRDQMSTLKKAGWQAVSLEDFEAYMEGKKELPARSFLITFDDGAKESFYPADPILQAFDYHAAIYVIAASSQIPESIYYLSPEELRWILKSGRWSIGSHSYDGHRPYVTDADNNKGVFFADRIWAEDANRLETPDEFTARVHTDLTKSKEILESTYGVPVNTFAFPLGNETGIEGANNFPAGAAVTEAQARSIYKLGFLQTNNQQFTFTFPISNTASSSNVTDATRNMLATNFLVRRIHVDHDWDGARLLSIMENGRMKDLPFEDDFSTNTGWITAWGSLDIGRNNFTLTAVEGLGGASTFLDGSELWDNYSFDATANWHNDYLFVMADVINSKTYDSCVFSPGLVRIQSVVNGEARTLAEHKDPAINYSDTARAGIRVHGNVIECTWNYGLLVEAYERAHSGGVGLQIWSDIPGSAQLQVSSVIARPLNANAEPIATTTQQ
jgi:peptidoglycan/xylan/chitin deacetylase (PgdA/CDA1 family)